MFILAVAVAGGKLPDIRKISNAAVEILRNYFPPEF